LLFDNLGGACVQFNSQRQGTSAINENRSNIRAKKPKEHQDHCATCLSVKLLAIPPFPL